MAKIVKRKKEVIFTWQPMGTIFFFRGWGWVFNEKQILHSQKSKHSLHSYLGSPPEIPFKQAN